MPLAPPLRAASSALSSERRAEWSQGLDGRRVAGWVGPLISRAGSQWAGTGQHPGQVPVPPEGVCSCRRSCGSAACWAPGQHAVGGVGPAAGVEGHDACCSIAGCPSGAATPVRAQQRWPPARGGGEGRTRWQRAVWPSTKQKRPRAAASKLSSSASAAAAGGALAVPRASWQPGLRRWVAHWQGRAPLSHNSRCRQHPPN
jgi:hypothetical protein